MSIRTEVASCLELLEPADRRKYRLAMVAQAGLAALDLIGVLLIGAVGLTATAAGTGAQLPARFQQFIDAVGLGDLALPSVAAVLGIAAAVMLIGKSVLSLLIQRRVSLFLAVRTTSVARRLIDSFLSQSLLEVQKRPSNWSSFAFIEGLTNAVTISLTQYLTMVGDVAVLVVLGGALLMLDPVTTVATIAYFALVVWMMSSWLGRWSRSVSAVYSRASISSREAVHDAIDTYRETVVAGRREYFRDRFMQQRWLYAKAAADNALIAAIPRFGMEIALVMGAVLLVVVLVVTGGTLADAVGSLALFLAAVARVMPSLLRLNSGVIILHGSAANAERTLTLYEEVRDVPASIPEQVTPQHAGPVDVDLHQVCLQYPGRESVAVDDISIRISAGQSVALVGPTGAGKSSLVDVILGVVPPTSGTVRIDGLAPGAFVAARPGALAYVPQHVAIVNGNVRTNVALGLAEVDDDRVWAALDRAHLGDFVRAQTDGLDTVVGERGVRISGGQRQRLGLARALYYTPSVLVLDEATSSLDAETEHAVTDTIGSLGDSVTTITVAHRLATIRNADVVVYLQDGRLVAAGTFAQVRAAVPQFERQASLLGL